MSCSQHKKALFSPWTLNLVLDLLAASCGSKQLGRLEISGHMASTLWFQINVYANWAWIDQSPCTGVRQYKPFLWIKVTPSTKTDAVEIIKKYMNAQKCICHWCRQ